MTVHKFDTSFIEQLSDQLGTTAAVFVVNLEGTLIYYNKASEKILGKKFTETGAMPVNEWSTIFTPTDIDGIPLLPAELPLMIARTEQRPAHRDFWIRGFDKVLRHLEVTAIPLVTENTFVGAMSIFWESERVDHSDE